MVPISAFWKNRRSVDGLHQTCRPCGLAYQRANAPARRLANRLYYATTDSARRAARRATARSYRSKYNPLGLRPEQRTQA